MTHRVREQILGYLLGALDDSEMEQVEARLRADPAYGRELARVRRQLEDLEMAADECQPPPGLVQRTCDFVFAHVRCARPRSVPAEPKRLSPHAAAPHWTGRVGWLDVTVAALIFVVAGLVTLPAIQGSRFQSRLITCQDNLRQLGLSLGEYSHRNGEYFPRIPLKGRLAAAGIYAPTLTHDGYLTEPHRVLCPESPQSEQRDFRVPSIEELQTACDREVARLRQQMGGSYGYCLGHVEHGVFVPTRNLCRKYFAIMADAPSNNLPERQSANHGGLGQNVLFEDGHVEFAATSQPTEGADDIFANDDHVVALGVHCNDSVIAPSGTAPIIFVSYR